MAESESTSEASAISSSKKKHINSKKRVLTKADQRKHLSERLQEADMLLLWLQITCKLNESRHTIILSESNSQNTQRMIAPVGMVSRTNHNDHI